MPGLRFLTLLALAFVAAAHAGFEEGEQAFTRRDYRTAMSELAPLADGGDARAQYYVGFMLLGALGATRDETKAADYLLRAAGQNHAQAQALLGALYLQGRGVARDDAKGADLIRRAADTGLAGAQYTMGLLLVEGRGGLPKDPATAVQWLKAAADQNHVPAYCWLGELADREKNGVEAVGWWRKGAAAGDRICQFQLGRAYAEGKGGLPRDANEALGWIRRAANQRLPAAQVALAAAYERGSGVPTDYVLSYMWFNLARAQGYSPPQVREAMDALEKKMTAEQIAEGQKRSREWRAGADIADALARAAPGATPGTAPGTPPAAAPPGATPRTLSGSGFVVSADGHIVTNHHVVAACQRVSVAPGDREAAVIARDARNDLALLKASPGVGADVARLRSGRGVRPGDDVVVVGFPLRRVLAPSAIVTTGTVSALSGLANDTAKLQIAAPVQQGNSGGPLLDRHGLVIGVVQSKLNALRIAGVTGDIPQNVNFAVNSATLQSFLEANGVGLRTAPPAGPALSAADVGEQAARFTVAIECAR
jgi:TPR repeat protein